jgi:quinolinate synthase
VVGKAFLDRKKNTTNGTCGWCHETIKGKYKVVHRTVPPKKQVRTHPECRLPYVRSMEGRSS